MANVYNLRGTSFPSFRIGKGGGNISQGATASDLIIAAVDDSTVAGGNIDINAGFGGAQGGSITLLSGTGIAGGGDLSLFSGSTTTAANAGNVTIAGGTSTGGGDDGNVLITTALASNTNGGDINLFTGDAIGANASAGSVSISAGDGTGANANAGNISISAGDGTGASAVGGDVRIRAAGGNAGNGGQITLSPGTGGGINLIPTGTAAGDTVPLRFFNLSTNGFNSVGFKAPDLIPVSTTWILPDGDGGVGEYLTTDGAGNLNWSSPADFLYEVYASAATTINATPTTPSILDYNTERSASANFALLVGGQVVVSVGGTYTIEYNTATETNNFTRDIIQTEIYINGIPYIGSRSYIYNRNTNNLEGSSTKRVTAVLVANDVIDTRLAVLSGNGCDTIANQCNLIIERKGP